MGTMSKEDFAGVTDGLSDALRGRGGEAAVLVLGADVGGKALFCACASEAAATAGVHCGELVKRAASVAGGGGGGSPTRAQAGGKALEKLDEALAAVERQLRTQGGER